MKIPGHIKGNYYARGKLLLTGEYGVLDGAKAIALPTKYGQHLVSKPTKSSDLIWESKDLNGKVWFKAQISLYDFSAIDSTDETKAKILQELLKNAVRLNSEFLSKWNGFRVETKLEFPLDWGLGSSSTLSHLVAQWADVHPILLHFKTHSGSGYDVACAGADAPIEYQLIDYDVHYSEIDYLPKFKDQLFFVHLSKKQNSKEAVEYYNKQVKNKKSFAKSLTAISDKIVSASSLKSFCSLLDEHEQIVAKNLNLKPIKEELFSDFDGSVKSLGAWGGDFVLAASSMDKATASAYFASKGFNTLLGWDEIILAE